MKKVRELIRVLDEGQRQRQLKVCFKGYNSKVLMLLECLVQEGFIYNYTIVCVKNVVIFLKYSRFGENGIVYMSYLGNVVGSKNVSFSELQVMALKGDYYIVSTDSGFVYSKNYIGVLKGKGGVRVCLLK